METQWKIGDWVDLNFPDDLEVMTGKIIEIKKGWKGIGKIYRLENTDGGDMQWYTSSRFIPASNPKID